MRFEWTTNLDDVPCYECNLFDGDKWIDKIWFYDYACEEGRKYDIEHNLLRWYAYMVYWDVRGGISLDRDEEFWARSGKEYKPGYQGKCTHTVDDIKRWCENWLAQKTLKKYYNILKEFDTLKSRAEWFESMGFKLEEERAE